MRLTPVQVEMIRGNAQRLLGVDVQITLFGSRVDDSGRGGDVDLMVEVSHPVDEPALLGAQLASQVSRALAGRKVDVVVKAPNLLPQPIHQIARQTGILL